MQSLSENDLETLRVGGLFHDIGKIGIPDKVLTKNERLTDKEFSQIMKHPSIGAQILGNTKVFQDIIPIVKHHHERFDGKGYPSKLSGDKIPYLVRIVTICDAFDAMKTVISEIEKCKGTQFDPEIANAFLKIIDSDEVKSIQEEFKFTSHE